MTLHADQEEILHGHFFLLTLALAVLLLAYPFWGRDVWGLASFDLVFWGVLLTSVYSVGRKRWLLLMGLALALPALVSDVAVYFFRDEWVLLVSCLLDLLFLLFITASIIAQVVKKDRVGADKIFGAICGYLMLGLVWALIYGALELSQPGSFQLTTSAAGTPTHTPPHWADLDNFIYYSRVTLSTLGYGDIVAVSRAARSLSAMEAIVGQLYLAILLARLIGLHIVQGKEAANG